MGYNYDKEFLGEPFNIDNLITEARELCKYSEKIVNQLHTERLDYELEYMPLIETIQVTSELCDALEKVEANNRWISVAEDLPKSSDYVWAWNGKIARECQYIGDEKWTVLIGVTHWMPLPAPPEKGGENDRHAF